ncbi:MAG: hypothetical protein KKB48_06610 [Gammaproteobacteria bacterium]|nr:hypothetical protein [Gammaproteobacteria bacterium]
MIKRRSNAVFIFILLAAFMALKWMPSHAHLNAQHDHGGEQHQHSVEFHAHQPVVFHVDVADADHREAGEAEIVDLDHDQYLQDDKQYHDSETLAAFEYSLPLVQISGIDLPQVRGSPPRLFYSHPGQPRAPPLQRS